MKLEKPPQGQCPHDADRTSCPLVCKYNHFQSAERTIDSWELKCLDCGWRDTIAYDQEDEEPLEKGVCPNTCPYCHQNDLSPGKNPCES